MSRRHVLYLATLAAVLGIGTMLWPGAMGCGDGSDADDLGDEDTGSTSEEDDDDDHPMRVDVGGIQVTRPNITIDDYPAIDGSTSTLPLARVIACELVGLDYEWQDGLGSEGEAEIVPVATTEAEADLARRVLDRIVHNRTHDAYLNLVDHDADLIMVANPPSPDERAYARARGVTLVWEPIGLDALVILVNASNSVSELSTDEVQRIFMGEIRDWADVGGAHEPIHPYVRPTNSGSQQLMNEIVMQGKPMANWPEDRKPTFMGALVDMLINDELSIGYSVFYWVTYQYPRDGIKVLAVDDVTPTTYTISDRSYPFTAPVWMVTRSDLEEGSTADQLHDWLLSDEGQMIVGRSGYVPYERLPELPTP